MKDPAFLFYPQDFLVGTMTMTFEDRGKYITLLSIMHQQGKLSEETIRFLVGSFSDTLRLKFKQDENGLFFNERLVLEIEKRTKFIESRTNNGKLGGRPKKEETYEKPLGYPTNNLIENENENENKDVIKRKKEAEIFDFVMPEFACFYTWLKYKKDRKEKYKSEDSIKVAYKKLLKLSGTNPEIAAEIVEQSMANNWAGLFELKNEKNRRSSRSGFESDTTADAIAKLRERAARL